MTATFDGAAGQGDAPRPGPRRRSTLGAALAALAVGMAGLVFGALPDGLTSAAGSAHDHGAQGGVVVGNIRVYGAYIPEPASPDVAAAYLSITNQGGTPDTLESVTSGASASVSVHDVPNGTASSGGGGGGGEDTTEDGMTPTGPLTIPGGATVTLAPTRGHMMLEGITGTLKAGDRVSLLLTFQKAGQVLVDAPVLPLTGPLPTGGTK